MYIHINSDTGLDQVHYTWAGAAVLEALCPVYPTVNFVLTDSDCVPTSLFEVAELVNLTTDRARAEAMQHHTMASSSQCPPAVLLMTESKAELNAGLIIVTGHTATQLEDIDIDTEAPDASMPAASAAHPAACDARAHKSRRLAHLADSKSPEEWVTALCNSRASFLATTTVPEDPAEALRGGLILTPLLGCKARTPLDWTHAWAMQRKWLEKLPSQSRKTENGHAMGTAYEGRTVLAAIALPPSLLTRSTLSYSRQVHLIHHADDRLCVWTPSHQDMKLLQQQRLLITHITGW